MKHIVFNEKAIEFFNGEKGKALDDIAVTIVHKDTLEQKDKEIERLNNIINDFEEELERESNIKEEDTCLEHNTFIDIRDTLKKVLKRFRELKNCIKESQNDAIKNNDEAIKGK